MKIKYSIAILFFLMTCFIGKSQENPLVIDGGYSISKSFEDRARYLSSQYGIEIFMPEGFSDITTKVNNFTFSSQPITKSFTSYCPAIKSDDSACVVLIEDYFSARSNAAANVPQQYLLEQELRTVIKNSENPEIEKDFEKILMSGEGRELDSSDLACVESRPFWKGRVEMFRACNTERSSALLADKFLKGSTVEYKHAVCMYVYPNNDICLAVKIFMTEEGLKKDSQYIEAVLKSISFEKYYDDIEKLNNVDGRYGILYKNESYKGECEKFHGKSCEELMLEVAGSDIFMKL